jgi:two-component system sensor histidine kinase BaeS
MIQLALLIGVIGATFLGMFTLKYSQNFRKRLSIRIAVVIFLTGPAVLLAIIILNAAYYGTLGEPAPWWSRLLQVVLVAIGTPLLFGLLAARYVTKPLGEFTWAINSIKRNDYQVRLADSGIYEFDRVFGQFNELFERLRDEETLRKNLISDTSHELNTPITALIGQLEGMKSGIIQSDSVHIDLLLDQANRLNDTSQRLVEYARIQSQTLRLEIDDIDIGNLVAEIAREYEHSLHGARADKKLLKQLLINLLQNAMRYSKGNAIAISYDGHRLRIHDNGQGIPSQSLQHIFERFYRVDTSRSRDTGGLGLGLAIVKEIVDAHQWHIIATNTHPGLMFEIDQNFTQDSQRPVLLSTMKTNHTISTSTRSQFREVSPWIAIAAISVGILLFTYTATQQNYRLSANDPQVGMAEDTARAWDNHASPTNLISSTKIDMAKSLAPFTIIIDTNDQVVASDGQLDGVVPLPPLGVFSDAHKSGELRFTWQTEGGQRFAAVVNPAINGYVLTARSLREIEQREQYLTIMAALTLLGIIIVLILAYAVVR